MKICVVGSGAREHCLALYLSKFENSVIVTPGNPGIELAGKDLNIQTTEIPPESIQADLFVIGPEIPLSEGLTDKLRAQDKVIFGPDQKGAMLESSKIWMKQALKKANIPTANFGVFDDYNEAISYLDTLQGGYVIKTDGLAAGKGVFVTYAHSEAIKDLKEKMEGISFGQAGKKVVIEELMEGRELSVMVLTDGKKISPLLPAVDAKRVYDNDEGPNTGGMGAYSPAEFLDSKTLDDILEKCIEPMLSVFKKENIDYRGLLYAGLMITESGPKIVEFNVRFGDPETQAVLPLLESDLASLIYQTSVGKLKEEPKFSNKKAINLVAASHGYPNSPTTGDKIYLPDNFENSHEKNEQLFFAGVSLNQKEEGLFTSSGRVLSVTSVGDSFKEARLKAYEFMSKISFEKMHYRNDIAKKAMDFEETSTLVGTLDD